MRLIDADAMKAEVELLDAESNNHIYKCAMEDILEFFIELIDKQPTIEPEMLLIPKEVSATDIDKLTEMIKGSLLQAYPNDVMFTAVRHGRMIEGRYPNENKCSECGQVFRDDIGFIIQDDGGIFHYPKRCPECGCYWDGGADNG